MNSTSCTTATATIAAPVIWERSISAPPAVRCFGRCGADSGRLRSHVRRQQVGDRVLDRVALVATGAEQRAADDLAVALFVDGELQLAFAHGADQDLHQVGLHANPLVRWHLTANRLQEMEWPRSRASARPFAHSLDCRGGGSARHLSLPAPSGVPFPVSILSTRAALQALPVTAWGGV